jgi:hypothetical protein
MAQKYSVTYFKARIAVKKEVPCQFRIRGLVNRIYPKTELPIPVPILPRPTASIMSI